MMKNNSKLTVKSKYYTSDQNNLEFQAEMK